METILEIDRAVFLFFNATLVHPILDVLLTHFTQFSFWTVPMTLTAGLFVYLSKDRKRALITLAVTAFAIGISSLICDQVIKEIVRRPRPCHPDFFVEGGRFLAGMRRAPSFPSAHSMNMFTGAAVLFCFYPKLKYSVWFFSFAAMIAYSRVYIGVHYPIDVTAGAILGTSLGIGIYRLYIMVSNRVSERMRRRRGLQDNVSDNMSNNMSDSMTDSVSNNTV